MTRMAYKERPTKHEHPNLYDKLKKMADMPVDINKMENRNFSCHTKTVCIKNNPFQKKSKTRKKGRKRKTRKTPVKKESSFFGLF